MKGFFSLLPSVTRIQQRPIHLLPGVISLITTHLTLYGKSNYGINTEAEMKYMYFFTVYANKQLDQFFKEMIKHIFHINLITDG